MALKHFFLIITVLSLVAISSGALVTDSITVDGMYWTAPDGVTIIQNLTIVGAGGSGTGGLYSYIQNVSNPYYTEVYIRAVGAGGKVGTKTTYNNIRVTPGESYVVHIGGPAAQYPGLKVPLSSSTPTTPYTYTAQASQGGTSYVVIDGVTYSAAGGIGGSFTLTRPAYGDTMSITSHSGTPGDNGYITSSALAQSGLSGGYGIGASGGVGYGAGGGGGGPGGDIAADDGGSGPGGIGAPGIVQFTYDSSAATAWYPTGYVKTTSATAIAGATVKVTQLLNTQTLTTDSNGYYSSVTGNFLATIPVNITISKAGYDTNVNQFTPLDTGGPVNTTLITSGVVCTPPCIDGITTTAWTHSTIPGASVYLIENVSRAGYQTNTSTVGGYYKFSNLNGGTVYDVWSTKSGFGNSSVYQVTAVII